MFAPDLEKLSSVLAALLLRLGTGRDSAGYYAIQPALSGSKPLFLFVLSILGCQRGAPPASAHRDASNKAEPQTTPTLRDWLLQESINKMDNVPEVTLAKLSEDGALDHALAIRCSQRKTEVLVSTGTVLDDRGEVRLKFDHAKPVRQHWSRSSDHVALFAEVTPLDEKPRVQEYRLAGLEDELPRVAAACNWEGNDRASATAKIAAERARSAEAALEKNIRDRLSPSVERCREKWMPQGKWCWYDANDSYYAHGSQGFDSRELAVQDAIKKAKSGRAFQSEMSRLNQR